MRSSGALVGALLTVVLSGVTTLVVLYYRRRFHRLKTELAHVHYRAEADQQLDTGHHFDNPVYSTFRASPSLCTASTPLNNARLHNRIVKNTNSAREKSQALKKDRSTTCLDEDDGSDTTSERGFGCTTGAFSYSSLHQKKCPDASGDYGNPNIYNALDNIKDNRELENVYEEIQKKMGKRSIEKSSSSQAQVSIAACQSRTLPRLGDLPCKENGLQAFPSLGRLDGDQTMPRQHRGQDWQVSPGRWRRGGRGARAQPAPCPDEEGGGSEAWGARLQVCCGAGAASSGADNHREDENPQGAAEARPPGTGT